MMDLLSLRNSCTNRNIPIISIETEAVLFNLLEQYRPKVCLEIGSAVGYSSIFIANKIKERGGMLYSFEISYNTYLEGLQNILKYELRNVVVYPFDFLKTDIKKLIPNTLDFVFIDGQKNQYANYLINIYDQLSKQNTLILDDVIKYKHKMIGLYEFLGKKQIIYDEIETEKGDGIIIIQN